MPQCKTDSSGWWYCRLWKSEKLKITQDGQVSQEKKMVITSLKRNPYIILKPEALPELTKNMFNGTGRRTSYGLLSSDAFLENMPVIMWEVVVMKLEDWIS